MFPVFARNPNPNQSIYYKLHSEFQYQNIFTLFHHTNNKWCYKIEDRNGSEKKCRKPMHLFKELNCMHKFKNSGCDVKNVV